MYQLSIQVPGTAANMAKADDEFAEADSEEKPMPDVPPPDFINCCKAVLLNFGNLEIDEERGDLSVQIKQIASEAEVVATRIYGKGMSAREQQVSYIIHHVVFLCAKLDEILLNMSFILFADSRIVHGRNRQHPSLILRHLKLKLNDEGRQHHGPILMAEMKCSPDLILMER